MKWNTDPKVKDPQVYLGVPCHQGLLIHGLFSSLLTAGRNLVRTQIENGSALTTNFNKLWCAALNSRKQGITHFCMVHSDVWPQGSMWLDKMLDIMTKHEADVLSVVVRLKDDTGLTSTAIEVKDETQHQGFRAQKLHVDEIEKNTTFSRPDLLINTGLMLCDIRKPWAEKVWFEFKDSIQFDEKTGTFYPVSLSEDYGFSRMVRSHGGKLSATNEITAFHMGNGKFGNQPQKLAPKMEVVS